jgi:hypothetical protein
MGISRIEGARGSRIYLNLKRRNNKKLKNT